MNTNSTAQVIPLFNYLDADRAVRRKATTPTINNSFDHVHVNDKATRAFRIPTDRFSLKVNRGYDLFSVAELLYCHADSNYTHLHFVNGEKYIVSKCLKAVADKINHHDLIRCHQSYLVNARFIKRVDISGPLILTLKNGDHIPISKSRKATVIKRLIM